MTITLMTLVLAGQLAGEKAEPAAEADAASEATARGPEATRPSTEERVAEVEGAMTAIEEKASALESELGALKKLKLSGYVQPRFLVHTGSRHGLDAKGRPAVKDGFTLRRGRLKATYTRSSAQLVLQIDATPTGVKLKDAEAWLFEPWTGKRFALVAGQTKWPFGYEVVQSSGDRELPERSRVVRAFAPGERDRGLKVAGKWSNLVFSGGVFDGNGTEGKVGAKDVVGTDNDRHKDLVGRVGVDFDLVTAGVSGWLGQTRRPRSEELDKADFDRTRVGADVQLYLDLLPLGGTAIKGEYLQGTTWAKDGVEQFGKKGRGWYALLVQSVTEQAALAARYDWFDGDTESGDVADGADDTKPASANAIASIGVAALYYVDETYKLTVAYERVTTGRPSGIEDPKDDLFTAQFQAKF